MTYCNNCWEPVTEDSKGVWFHTGRHEADPNMDLLCFPTYPDGPSAEPNRSAGRPAEPRLRFSRFLLGFAAATIGSFIAIVFLGGPEYSGVDLIIAIIMGLTMMVFFPVDPPRKGNARHE